MESTPTVSDRARPSRAEGRRYLVLVLWGGAIGIPAAFLAYGFLALVHWLEHLLWTDLPDALGQDQAPWYLVVGLPVAGAAVVCLARLFLPGDGGHTPIQGIKMGPTPWRYGPGIALAALGTLAFGAVLGPEAPLVALGAACGMVVIAVTRAEARAEDEQKREAVLSTAGSCSAISALFGGPLVAGILILEGGLALGPTMIPLLLPALVSAAVGYLLFIGLGDWGGFEPGTLVVPALPEYDGTYVIDLVLAIVVGVLATLILHVVYRLGSALLPYDSGRRSFVPLLLLGGLAVGVLAQVAVLLGADSDEILFSGQSAVPALVAETSIGVLLVILAAKAIGFGICLGCGFRGGPVFPGIFIGVAVACLAVVLFDTSITWAVAVGAAAGMTGGSGLVISSLLFSLLLVGSNGSDALPAAVFAVVAAWITRTALPDRSQSATSRKRVRDATQQA